MGTNDESRRELEKMYGKGVTPQSLLGVGRAMARPLTKSQRAAVEAQLAAEDAERAAEEVADEAWWQAARRRDNKR